jgi:excisionase family DNA binding protein
MTKGHDSDFISVTEIVELTGKSRQTIAQWAREGKLPAQRPGRFNIFKRRKVERWWRQQTGSDGEQANAA